MAGAVSPFSLPVGIFQGYDKVLGDGRSTAVTGRTEVFGGSSSVVYRVCLGMEELSAALEVEQSLTVRFGNVGSMSQKLQFVNNQNLTTHSVCIVIYAKRTQGRETVTNVGLESHIERPESSEELKEFFKVYGDSYMSSRALGGEYYAVYSYYSETQEEQLKVITEMQAAGIYSGISADASLGTKVNNFNSSQTTRISSSQNMFGMADQAFPPSDEMIQFALNFSSLPLTAPGVIHFEVTGYERVPGIGSSFGPIARNRDLILHDPNFTRRLFRLEALQNDISYIRNIYSFYGGYRDDKLEQVRAQADADVKAVEKMIREFATDPINSVVRPVLSSIDNGTPSLQYEIGESELYGGDGGEPFDDVGDVRAYLQRQTRITALQIRLGSVVDQLMVAYSDGRRVYHGASGGAPTLELRVPLGAFVTSMSGSTWEVGVWPRRTRVVSSLTISLSNRQSVSTGSKPNDPRFSWELAGGRFALGFRGRSGSFLDQIQMVSALFKPALWQTS